MVEFITGKGWRARASYIDAAGVRHQKSKSWFARKKDAQAWEDEYIKANAGAPADADTLTVAELLTQYLKLREPVISPNTYYGYENCARRITAHLGDMPIRQLNRLRIESAYADMRNDVTPNGKPIRAATIAYAHRVLKAALNYAVDCDILRKNPATGARLPEDTDPFKAQTIASKDAEGLLMRLRQHDSQLYIVVLLELIYGMRRGEALGLRWQDIDFTNGRIHISGQYTVGADHKPEWKPQAKTKSSRRDLVLVKFVTDELHAIRSAFPRGYIPYYVCELDGQLPSPNAISHRWKKFASTCGFPGVRMHDLRHSSAMMMIQAGADLVTVMSTLGHSKIETTQRYLSEDFEVSARVANQVVANIFDSTPAKEKQKKSV